MEEPNHTESLIGAYLRGELSPEEAARVEQMLPSDGEAMEAARAESIIGLLAETAALEKQGAALHALRRVKASIERTKKRQGLLRLERFAAIIAIPLLIVSIYLFSSIRQLNNTDIEITSNTGMTSSVVLPDSTRVWLNSNSTLRYPARFAGGERRVILSGEAYFEVAQAGRQKFIVETGDAVIEVYGTEFNVEAYPEDQNIYTTLVEGGVAFRYENNRGEKIRTRMTPGQALTYNRTGKYTWSKTVDTAVGTSWREGKIILNDTPLDEALRMVGNKYHVTFIIRDEKLREHTFIGKFSDQTLDTILRYFTLSSDINFSAAKKSGGSDGSGRDIIEVY